MLIRSCVALTLSLFVCFSEGVLQPVCRQANAQELCTSCVRIGILPLKYDGEHKKLGLYAQGTQDSLIYALSAVSALVVIDRSRTNEVLKELAFQQSAYLNPQTQVKIGQLLGVDYLYTGSIQEVNGRLRIIIERIHVASGQVSPVAQVTGQQQELFELQDQIASKILLQSQTPVSVQEQQTVRKYIHVTASLPAFEHYSQGLVHDQAGASQQAIAAFSEAIALDPAYADAYFNRGVAYHRLERYTEAIADYTQATRLYPSFGKAYNNRGLAYGSLKQYEKAIADYTQAMVHIPTYPKAYYNRALAYRQLQQYDKAVADYSRALALDPTYVNAYINRGLAYHYLQQYDKAIADYSQAIARDSQDATAYFNRGLAQSNLQQHEQAVADFRQVIALNPEDAAAYGYLGWSYLLLQQPELAVKFSRQGLSKEPTASWIQGNLVLALLLNDQYAEASQLAEQLIQQAPETRTRLLENIRWLQSQGIQRANLDKLMQHLSGNP